MANWTDEVKGRLGFGCMRLPNGGGTSGYGELCQMVDAFLDAGFNYFDTARPYHGGKSETALRECLVKRHPRESFFITDKLSTQTWSTEHDIDRVLDDELASLGVDCLDMLLMHAQNATNYEKYQSHGAFERAAAFKAAGKTRHVGISFHDSPDVLERILGIDKENMANQINLTYTKFFEEAIMGVDKGEFQCSFILNPTRVTEIRDVAAAGEKMPQKSTYFYPKMITGMVMNDLSVE